jgi:fructosamine-3-kinase
VIELQPNLELTVEEAERLLYAWLDVPVVCSSISRLEGGLVNTVLRLDFDHPPHHAVVKLHGADGDTLAAEARALDYLRSETVCPVPGVYLHDDSRRLIPHCFLLLEYISGACLKDLDLEPAERADIEAQLADVLAELHGHEGDGWGDVTVPQRSSAWADVFAARLAEVRAQPEVIARLESDVLAKVDSAIDAVPFALADSGRPTLVHGDVWDGNMIVRREDDRWRLAALVDPALQYADVELELAYLEVFDVSRDSFFAAYTNQRALRPGYEERRLFYWLHTALVHVALFGDRFFCEFTAATADSISRLQLSADD